MGKRVQFVGPDEVRAWGREHAVSDAAKATAAADRGRLSKALVQEFEDANPGVKYNVGGVEPTVTVRVPTTNVKGVTSRRKQSIPASEAREYALLLGAGERGRLSADTLNRIGIALLAD